MFIRRRGGDPDRYARIRIGLIFLAAGVWLGGLITGRESITGLAILILVAALVLQVIARREGR